MKNYSRQREEIIRVIKDIHSHPTAEEIYMNVKAKDPALSRSTVYRNLTMLVENNIVSKISMQVGPDRFDYVCKNHNHVICTKCGTIIDFEYDLNFEELSKSVLENTGVELSPYGITLNGVCAKCKNK